MSWDYVMLYRNYGYIHGNYITTAVTMELLSNYEQLGYHGYLLPTHKPHTCSPWGGPHLTNFSFQPSTKSSKSFCEKFWKK